MGGTLKTQNFKILSTPLSFKYKIAELKCNQICYMVTFVEQTSIKQLFCSSPIQVPRVKSRFEVLLKKFHPMTNLTTFF
jgi:hypothetical protein